MAIDPEYLPPDNLFEMLLSTFQQSTSGMFKNFLGMHRSVRKWLIVSDFVIADPLPHPKPRQRRLQPSADPHRRDPQRQPGGIVGLGRDAAQRRNPKRRLESS
jgi:hypothetical protein